jgi:hypothetical protein
MSNGFALLSIISSGQDSMRKGLKRKVKEVGYIKSARCINERETVCSSVREGGDVVHISSIVY